MKVNIKKFGLSLLVLAAAPLALAQGPSPSPTPPQGDEAELENLLQILSEETAVATRTRMNGDYVPGIVTVLHGDELAALGARTVWDALSLVPGIEAVRDGAGLPSVTVRGLQFPFNSGNVKVLVDSMPATRDNAGVNGMILDMPIQIVERIEVIRGPGSVVYGDFAYMGLIHIITRKTGTGLYGRYDEGGGVSGGFFAGGKTPEGLEYALSASAFGQGTTDLARRGPGDDSRGFIFGSVKYGGFSVSNGVVARDLRTAQADGSFNQHEQAHWVIEARYARDLSPTARIEARLNRRHNQFEAIPNSLRGSVIEGGLSLQWTGASRQSWLFDSSLIRSHIDNAHSSAPRLPPTPPGAPPRPPIPAFDVSDETLVVGSLMAQNTIDASDKLALTLGARLDHYSDVDTRVTPRASLVYRASDRNIVKFQYAEGFRAPSFFELYSRGSRYTPLDFEVNQTSEVNFVHRRPSTVMRLTGFFSRFPDLIYSAGINADRQLLFENERKARAAGMEFEVERELGHRLKAVGNGTLIDIRDSRNIPREYVRPDSVPRFLVNVALIAAPGPRTRLTARWHFVSSKASDQLPAYSEFFATLTQKDVLTRHLDLRAGIRLSPGDGVIYPIVQPLVTNAVSFEFPKAFVELTWSR